jgi:glycosyltransferase involved in cell wall biosynthesis
MGADASVVCLLRDRGFLGEFSYQVRAIRAPLPAPRVAETLREAALTHRALARAPDAADVWFATSAAEVPWANALAFRHGGAVVAWLHWFPIRNLPEASWPAVRSRSEGRRQDAARRERSGLPAAHAVVAVSEYIAKLVEGHVPAERLHVVRNGLDHPASVPPASDGPPNVLYIGRLSPGKGVSTLLRAWRLARGNLGDATLTIAGAGDATEVERAAADSSGGVTYLGYIEGDERERAFARAAVVAAPSDDPEPWGLSALEGMARGRPLVGTALGGMNEYLKHGVNGWAVPPGDADALAYALTDAVGDARDRPRWEVLSREAVATARGFTWKGNLAGLQAVWKEAIGRARA